MRPNALLSLLQKLNLETPPFPPTLLYNEGWLLRIILDWFAKDSVPGHPLSLPKRGRWFSDALLPSAFLARHRGDRLRETRTHADAAIGHITIEQGTKAGVALRPEAEHLIVVEAKLSARLSPGTTRIPYYDQAARSVACIAEVLKRAGRPPSEMSVLGFHILAPAARISAGVFRRQLDPGSIRKKVRMRASAYEGGRDAWYRDWFEPTLDRITIRQLSWEEIIEVIRDEDPAAAESIGEFYADCLELNA